MGIDILAQLIKRPASSRLQRDMNLLIDWLQIVAPNGVLTLGGWELDEDNIFIGDAILHSEGWLRLGSGTDIIQLDAHHATHRAWAGHTTVTAAPFQLTRQGKLLATGADIAGKITSSEGYIAGWTLGAGHLFAGTSGTRVGMQPGAYPFYAGHETPGSAPFRVSAAGAITATNADIAGKITSAEGEIAGWTLGSGHLYAGAGAARVGLRPTDWPFYAGNENPALAPYRVSAEGALVATGASIQGHIEALTGEMHELDVLDTLTLKTAGAIQSDNFVTGVSGWRINHLGQAEFQDALVRGQLNAVEFVENTVSTVGGTLLVSTAQPAATAGTAFTVPALGSMTTAYFTEAFQFDPTAGDRVSFTDEANAVHGILAFHGIIVGGDGSYAGHLFRNDGEATPGNVFAIGSLALNLSQSPDGYLLMTANPVLKGPRYVVVDTSGTGERPVGIMGNLDGSYGISGGTRFGVGIGDYASGNYLRWEPTGGFVLQGGDGAVSFDSGGLALAAPEWEDPDGEAALRFRYSGDVIGSLHANDIGGQSAWMSLGMRGAARQNTLSLSAQADSDKMARSSLAAWVTGGSGTERYAYIETLVDWSLDVGKRSSIGVLSDRLVITGTSGSSTANARVDIHGSLHNSVPIGCYVRRHTTRQAINNNTWTAIAFDTRVEYVGGTWWTSANANRVIAPEDGFYDVTAWVMLVDPNTTGVRQLALRNQAAAYLTQAVKRPERDVAFGFTNLTVSLGRHWMAAGEWVEVAVFQNSGTNTVEVYEAANGRQANGVTISRVV